MKKALLRQCIKKQINIFSNIVLLICLWTNNCHATGNELITQKTSHKKIRKQTKAEEPDLESFIGTVLNIKQALLARSKGKTHREQQSKRDHHTSIEQDLDLINNKKVTINQIARKYGISHTIIVKMLKRKFQQRSVRNNYPPITTLEADLDLIDSNGLSINQAAQRHRVDHTVVAAKLLQKFGPKKR